MSTLPSENYEPTNKFLELFQKLSDTVEKVLDETLQDELLDTVTDISQEIADLLKDNRQKTHELHKIFEAREYVRKSGATNVATEVKEAMETPEFASLKGSEKIRAIITVAQSKLIEENAQFIQDHLNNATSSETVSDDPSHVNTGEASQLQEELQALQEELEETQRLLHQTTRRLKKQERVNRSLR
jgi:gas vesicle protein